MELFYINVGVIFAFGLMITAIVLKGLMLAKNYDAEHKAFEVHKAAVEKKEALEKNRQADR